jgi:hypothetical protein
MDRKALGRGRFLIGALAACAVPASAARAGSAGGARSDG